MPIPWLAMANRCTSQRIIPLRKSGTNFMLTSGNGRMAGLGGKSELGTWYQASPCTALSPWTSHLHSTIFFPMQFVALFKIPSHTDTLHISSRLFHYVSNTFRRRVSKIRTTHIVIRLVDG